MKQRNKGGKKCSQKETETGETIQDISEAADSCVAGNRTNTPGLIKSQSGKAALSLVVKPLLNGAAPLEHSSHPRKGLMHGENLTLPNVSLSDSLSSQTSTVSFL